MMMLSKLLRFISYYPLKQGLKLEDILDFTSEAYIYILLSIKTRIETDRHNEGVCSVCGFISYYPLKQGLKLYWYTCRGSCRRHLYPTIH